MRVAFDLGCGGGGASRGLERAGFKVIGVDIKPQPHYPYEFVQEDALVVLQRILDRSESWPGAPYPDFIWWSPPCQRWSRMSKSRPGLGTSYPDLITPARALLRAGSLPWVIENVPGAPLNNPVMLCSSWFGRETYRHRLFEFSGFGLGQPPHLPHTVPASKAGHWQEGTYISVAGHCAPMWKAREVMDISWLPRDDLVEAIPPYFSEFIGRAVLAQLQQPGWAAAAAV